MIIIIINNYNNDDYNLCYHTQTAVIPSDNYPPFALPLASQIAVPLF